MRSRFPVLPTLNNNKVSIGVGNSFSDNRQPDMDQGPAHGESRSRDSAHSNEPGEHGKRNRLVFATSTLTATQAFAANQVSTATLNGALPINGLRKTQYFGYIQDEFKWRPNLTLNLGATLQLLQYFS